MIWLKFEQSFSWCMSFRSAAARRRRQKGQENEEHQIMQHHFLNSKKSFFSKKRQWFPIEKISLSLENFVSAILKISSFISKIFNEIAIFLSEEKSVFGTLSNIERFHWLEWNFHVELSNSSDRNVISMVTQDRRRTLENKITSEEQVSVRRIKNCDKPIENGKLNRKLSKENCWIFLCSSHSTY